MKGLVRCANWSVSHRVKRCADNRRLQVRTCGGPGQPCSACNPVPREFHLVFSGVVCCPRPDPPGGSSFWCSALSLPNMNCVQLQPPYGSTCDWQSAWDGTFTTKRGWPNPITTDYQLSYWLNLMWYPLEIKLQYTVHICQRVVGSTDPTCGTTDVGSWWEGYRYGSGLNCRDASQPVVCATIRDPYTCVAGNAVQTLGSSVTVTPV